MFSRSIKPTTMRSEYLPPWVYLEQHHLFKKVSNSVWMKKDSSLSCFNLEQKLNPTKDKEICFNGKCILSFVTKLMFTVTCKSFSPEWMAWERGKGEQGVNIVSQNCSEKPKFKDYCIPEHNPRNSWEN